MRVRQPFDQNPNPEKTCVRENIEKRKKEIDFRVSDLRAVDAGPCGRVRSREVVGNGGKGTSVRDVGGSGVPQHRGWDSSTISRGYRHRLFRLFLLMRFPSGLCYDKPPHSRRDVKLTLLPLIPIHPFFFAFSFFEQPEATEAAVEEAADDEAVCYLRGVHMSPYKVRTHSHTKSHSPRRTLEHVEGHFNCPFTFYLLFSPTTTRTGFRAFFHCSSHQSRNALRRSCLVSLFSSRVFLGRDST